LSTINGTKPQGLIPGPFSQSLKSLGCIPKSEKVSCWDCNANSTHCMDCSR